MPEKKVTPAGKALTPQTTEEPVKPKANDTAIKSKALVVTDLRAENGFPAILAITFSY